MGTARAVLRLLLALSMIAFINVSLWLFINKESHLRRSAPEKRLEERPAVNSDKQITPSDNIEKPLPLLMLFTCFTREQGKAYIQTNTLRNWALFRPLVQPMLYTDYEEGPLIEFAKQLGWYVMPVPKMSSIGVPYLKNMYLTAMKTHKSMLYGYANGDILFTDGFVETLREVVRQTDSLNTTLVVGRRTNYNINFTNWSPVYQLKDVKDRSMKGSLFATNAEDYFFVTVDFPWRNIPDLVIGRRAYDNFLVGFSIKRNISVVDATKTVIALHQTGADGNFAGHKRSDSNFNTKLIAKVVGHFAYGDGITSLAQYESQRDFIGNTFIKKRPSKSTQPPKRKQ